MGVAASSWRARVAEELARVAEELARADRRLSDLLAGTTTVDETATRLSFRFESSANGWIALGPCGQARSLGVRPISCQPAHRGVSLGRDLVEAMALSWEPDADVERRARRRGAVSTGRCTLAERDLDLVRDLAAAEASGLTGLQMPMPLRRRLASYVGPSAVGLPSASLDWDPATRRYVSRPEM